MSWYKLFNKPNFVYNQNSSKIKVSKNYSNVSINLLKVVYPVSSLIIRNYINYIIGFLNPKKNEKILDFGSGNGALLYYIMKKFKSAPYSIEINRHLILFQREKLKIKNTIKFKKKNFKINFHQNFFDKTMCNSVIQYFENKISFRKQLNEIIRVTKYTIIITDIKNSRYRDKFINKQILRQQISKKEYLKKYKNFKTLDYLKKDFYFLKKINKVRSFTFKKMPKNFFDSEMGRFSLIIKLKY